MHAQTRILDEIVRANMQRPNLDPAAISRPIGILGVCRLLERSINIFTCKCTGRSFRLIGTRNQIAAITEDAEYGYH